MFPMMAALVGLPILVILSLAAAKPSTFRVERRTRIKAAPDQVFALLEDFHAWLSWSPWEKLDPGMTRTHSGPVAGRGAVYEWEGNRKVGKGRMEIIDATRPSRLAVKLDFFRPFEAHNTAEFTLAPAGDATDVTWAMYGPHTFSGKLMSVFVTMDKMVGGDFERGLANLKRDAEQGTWV